MSPEQTKLIQQTWELVLPSADNAARLFYDRLFAIDPGAAKLFHGRDMKQQRQRLLVALNLVVEDVDQLESLIPVLQELGRSHAGYGVRDQHYDSVGAALLWTLHQVLGPGFTSEIRSAWAIAYAFVSGVMREAGHEHHIIAA